MSNSPGLVPKKPGPQPLKATHPFILTPTPECHTQIPYPPTKIKTSWKSGQRKHSFGRLSPPEARTRAQKVIGIHRTGSLGSLDPSLKYFASPRLFPPSPILPHSHTRSSPVVPDSDGSSVRITTESVRKFKRFRPIRSTSLDSADPSRNISTAKAQHTYPIEFLKPLPLPLPIEPPHTAFPEGIQVSMDALDQEIALALNGLTIANQPEVCPDGHVAPAPFPERNAQSAGANSSPRYPLDMSPGAALSRDSGSACSSSPDPKPQPLVKGHSSSPRCLFYREPPRGAVSVEMRVASISAYTFQAPDPRKVGVVTCVGHSGFMSAASAFTPIHKISDGKPMTLST